MFGDNLKRHGLGGAATLRNEPNTWGFITKKAPNNLERSFYHPGEYKQVYRDEMHALRGYIKDHPHLTFLITPLGSGLANRYKIWENIIRPNIRQDLAGLPNVKFLWRD